MRQSAISTFEKCPYNYKLQYIDELDVYPSQDAASARIIGTALHYGCETRDITKALNLYYGHYYVINEKQINEAIKLKALIPKVWDVLDQMNYKSFENEVYFHVDDFHGTVDLIAHNDDGTIDLYDFKYSNNVEYYLQSPQLHIYKYYLEKIGYKVNKLGFIFIPKTQIRQKKTESIATFRMRLNDTLESMQPRVEMINYDPQKVADAFNVCMKIYTTKEFKPTPSKLCDWCDFKGYCQKGEDYMLIPKNERKSVDLNRNPDMWIYGASYVGKTSFVDQLDDTLILNTDGNTDTITSPVISIRDVVTKEGRITKRKYAWEVLKETIEELEADTHGFKNLAVDLVEDLREHCRLYMYAKHGWEHEQDGGYGKGYDMIKLEFLSTMKRLKNIKGLRLILISKQMTREVSRGASTVTTYAPNIKEDLAEVLAGIVDMTVLVGVDKDGDRYMQFKKSPYVFGGSRFDFKEDRIELDIKALDQAIINAGINVNYENEIKTNVAMNESGDNLAQEVAPSDTGVREEETPTRRRNRG